MISRTFNLNEYTRSATAAKMIAAGTLSGDEQYKPPQSVIANLKALHENLVVKLMDALPDGELKLNSAYRCAKVNSVVGGVSNSKHLYGYAADLEYYEKGKEINQKILDALKNITHTKAIDEYNKSWIHVEYIAGQLNNKSVVIK